jgi:hypothetical protein
MTVYHMFYHNDEVNKSNDPDSLKRYRLDLAINYCEQYQNSQQI